MSTTTDNYQVDEAMAVYVEWLELSVAVQDAYDRWTRGPRSQTAASFAEYTRALDLEERSALHYAELVAMSARSSAGSSPV